MEFGHEQLNDDYDNDNGTGARCIPGKNISFPAMPDQVLYHFYD
jgi:hypothetical protein